ncbi:MAG: GNAT family N-acetyltransferase [Bacteriovoracaceae bacterium]|nr:GNAT family N-acetyltransferase [Bacteriovoracaceae bacterium]
MSISSPFLKEEFYKALLHSQSIGKNAGWIPQHFSAKDSTLCSYLKNHSYGEYIFDWSWAQAYERYGIAYYPKLVSMIPFTSATTNHFSGERWGELLEQHLHFMKDSGCSSSHFLFTTTKENDFLQQHDFLIRESMQYHFFNENYSSFEDFLQRLKAKKAKNILKERAFSEVKIERLTGNQLKEEHALEMYEFYRSTIDKKNAIPYLKKEFFQLVFQLMPHHLLYVRATRGSKPIAGAVYFYSKEILYGRYWGSLEEESNLHFELCYYQGIEFCIERKMERFEAGAQGEHKIARGFRPVRTYSAHFIRHPAFKEAISNFINEEKHHLASSINELSSLLTFKA